MKHNRCFLAISYVFVVVFSMLMLSSCSLFGGKTLIKDADDFYDAFKTSKKTGLNISIEQDITIDSTDTYFKAGDRSATETKINGNGHTITVEGTADGKLGDKTTLLFDEFKEVEISNLNIVYNLTIDLSSKSGNLYVGGLVGSASDSTITNCETVFNYVLDLDFKTDSYGFHDYAFGGIVGYSNNSIIENCKSTYKVDYTGCYLGGVVGYAKSSTIKNCDADTTITTSDLEEAYIGGIVGELDNSTLSESYSRVRKFEMNGRPQDWRNRTAYGGLFVGGAIGNSIVKNCYIDRDDDMDVESENNGLFITTMKCGWIAGLAEENAEFKNLYINGYGTGDHAISTYDFGGNIKLTTPDDQGGFYVLASSFISKCSTLNIKNVYYVYGTDRDSGYDETLSFFPYGYGPDAYLIDNGIVNDSYVPVDYFKFVNDYENVKFAFDELGEKNPWIVGSADEEFIAGRPILDKTLVSK